MINWAEIANQFLYIEDEPLLFHHGFFLFIFSIFLLAYSFAVKEKKWQHLIVILFSFYFYYKASGVFLLLLLLTVSADYGFSYLIEKQKVGTKKKVILFVSILFSLSFLLYFKYKNFFLQNYGALTGQEFDLHTLILPIGISFYTFQSISYLVDIYQGKVKRPPFYKYMMYMAFFPHLVAGPIVRAKDFLPQIYQKLNITKEEVNRALLLIIGGLLKKTVISDYISINFVDRVFDAPSSYTAFENLMASYGYAIQIYCDFLLQNLLQINRIWVRLQICHIVLLDPH